MTYADMLRALYGQSAAGIKLGLETMELLLEALGHPERKMRHIVVSGTNGKGSTSALIASALRAAGHRVGHYTSPHLLRFTERINCDGEELARDTAVALYLRVAAAAEACPRPPTFFELTTAMALVAFAETALEICVLEVGLGGRLDATNVVEKTLSVVTPIGLDHQQYLGDTISEIAAEKAGIISRGGTVVLALQPEAARLVVEQVCEDRGAQLVHAGDFARGRTFVKDGRSIFFAKLPGGAYQRMNVATATTALWELDRLGISCPDAAIARAAEKLAFPGRYEWIAADPPLLIDGAHNPPAIEALLEAMAEDPRIDAKPVHVVATVLCDRPPRAMLDPLLARCASLHLTPVDSSRSRTAAELAMLDPRATAHDSASAALDAASRLARASGGVVLLCGSLFLAGAALALVRGEPRDPPIDG